MSTFNWTDDVPVIDEMSFDDVVAKLREMDDEESAADLENARLEFYTMRGRILPSEAPWNDEASAADLDNAPTDSYTMSATFSLPPRAWTKYKNKPWGSTEYQFGYLANFQSNDELQVIVHAGSKVASTINPNDCIKITLERFQVVEYPGSSPYHILLKFSTGNQIQNEDLHFSIISNASKGGPANIYGYPIFVGLNVGLNGIIFKFDPIVLKDSEDKKILSFLESDVFQSGLRLLSLVNPAVALFSIMTNNLFIYVAKHRKNAKVRGFNLGLDFGKSLPGYRLAEGSYIAVQIPKNDDSIWKWDQWVYQTTSGLVVNKGNPTRTIPYNYLI